MPVERDQFFQLMASFASGVTVVTCKDDAGVRRGFTASAFTSLSLDPRLCLVSVDNRSESLPIVRETGVFAINILSASQEQVSRTFASKIADKFAEVSHRDGPATGAPLIDGALAHVECRVFEMLPGGDHTVVVGEIQDGDAADGAPLLYFRGQYRALAELEDGD